jgi:hypothetical protein
MAVFYYRPLIPGVGEPGLSAGGIFLAGWLVTEAVARFPGTGHPAFMTTTRAEETVDREVLLELVP